MNENGRILVNAGQIRAARALLNWSQEDLASFADLSVATIRKIESGHISPRDKTMDAIRMALETARIEFLPPMGVKLRTNDVSIYEGDDCYMQLLDDIHHTVKNENDEVLFLNADGTLVTEEEIHSTMRIKKNGVKWRFLMKEGNTEMPYPVDEFRWLPTKFFKRHIVVIYGSKVAMGVHVDQTRNLTTKIIAIDSVPLSASIKVLYEFMWENCRKPTFSTAKKIHT